MINLTSSLPERRTWQEVHQEWKEEGGERSRGKILLLYSPDTKLFKELQEGLPLSINILYKIFSKIDQHLARHFKYNGASLSSPPPFL